MTSLNWTMSSPSFGYGFSHYELDYSYDGSTYYVYKNITSQSTTSIGYLWCPTCAMWWEEYTIDSSPVGGFIEASGALQGLTQPANASTRFVWSNDTSVWIDWTNPSTYGGNISYVSYEVYESVNGSAYSLDTAIYNVSQYSYFVGGLSPDTNYSFYVKTWDHLSDAFLGGLYQTNSTSTSFTTPPRFSALAGVNRTSADVGQNLSFQCGVFGGLAPYGYEWALGDGNTSLASSTVHAYGAPGNYTASCAAFDHADSVATSQVGVDISAEPTVGTPNATPSDGADQGKSVTFNVSATNGSGGLSYVWSGLPGGCSTANSSSITCVPSGSGTFSIVVTVTDSNGGSARSAALNYTVRPTFLGLPATEGYWLTGGIVAAVAAVALSIILLVRRKKKNGAPPPDTASAGTSGAPSGTPPDLSPTGRPPGSAP